MLQEASNSALWTVPGGRFATPQDEGTGFWAGSKRSKERPPGERRRGFATKKGSVGVTQSSDIVRDLGAWLDDASARQRGQKPEIDVSLVRRAIAEINSLRETLGSRRSTRSIAAEDLNASNDE